MATVEIFTDGACRGNPGKQESNVVLTTDSQYVRKGITEWLSGWKANGWKTSAKKPVKNVDLWQEIDRLSAMHTVEWRWVKGHSGHAENERVDDLANRGIDELPAASD